MIAKQKQMLETFVRVRAFVAAHPVAGPLRYGGAPETLEEVVPRVREYAGVQVTGRALSSAELRVQAKLVKQLLVRHMRPIAAIARAQIEPESDVRMPAAIKMPRAARSRAACAWSTRSTARTGRSRRRTRTARIPVRRRTGGRIALDHPTTS